MNFLIDVDLKDIKILSHTDGESKMTKLFFKLKFLIFTKIIDSIFLLPCGKFSIDNQYSDILLTSMLNAFHPREHGHDRTTGISH